MKAAILSVHLSCGSDNQLMVVYCDVETLKLVECRNDVLDVRGLVPREVEARVLGILTAIDDLIIIIGGHLAEDGAQFRVFKNDGRK